MGKFEEIETSSELVRYLKSVLSRTGGKNADNAYLYHYTDVKGLCGILKTKRFWLNSSKSMNDRFEKGLLENYKLNKRLFYLCCSTTGDNISLWNMYGNDCGMMIAIPYYCAKKMFEQTEYLAEDNRIELQDAFWSSIAYYNRTNNSNGCRSIRCGSVRNRNIDNPIQKEEFAGLLKSVGWSNENEVRLSVITKGETDAPHLELRLPKGFTQKCQYYFSPLMSEAEMRKAVQSIHLIDDSVQINNSMYYGEVLPISEWRKVKQK